MVSRTAKVHSEIIATPDSAQEHKSVGQHKRNSGSEGLIPCDPIILI